MDPIATAVLTSWSVDLEIVLALGITCAVYLRGFSQVHAQSPVRFPGWRRGAFLAGIGALLLALASPLDAFADLLLQFHMAQHWLLMMVAPPLLWLGAPTIPLMRGLPRRWLTHGLGPFLAWPALQRGLRRLTNPVFAWLAWAGMTLLWHSPTAYQAALRSTFWHDVEHLSFLTASLLFWYSILEPWPARRRGPRLARALSLGLAALFNTIFSASFAFSSRVFYPAYEIGPKPWDIDPLADQNAAGGLLWVAASIPMLVAAVLLVATELEGSRDRRRRAPAMPTAPGSRGRPRSTPWRRRREALANRFSSHAVRRTAQGALLVLALIVALDGWLGPAHPSALNLAGVLPWTYWRGALVLGVLLLGNVFCAVCPFTLTRRIAARCLGRPLAWPAWLQNRWPAFGLFFVFLCSYESFALWDRPAATAWIVVGFFVACFAVEGLFPRGRFCRHLCPIGQFQFVQSGVSPLEVKTLDERVCKGCQTHDCLRGNETTPGCPTELFLPAKSGNLDCTFCLDCVRACPEDNIDVLRVVPGRTLGHGRPPRPDRGAGLDAAALALLFCFGAFVNAAAMTGPVTSWNESWLASIGANATPFWLGLEFALALLVAPALCAWGCARLSSAALRGGRGGSQEILTRMIPALTPIGLSMWLSHYGFHLLTGIDTLGPAGQRAAAGLGWPMLWPGIAPSLRGLWSHETLVGLQITLLGLGLIWSVATAWRLAREAAPTERATAAFAAPWMGLGLMLYVFGVWITLQPMQMRGMVMG